MGYSLIRFYSQIRSNLLSLLAQAPVYIKKTFVKENEIVWTLIILCTIVLVWVNQGFYQSHYLSALRILGDYKTQNVIGYPREGRGDEWSTYLPMLKQAYLEGFPDRSSLEPYHEKFDWIIAIPKRDFSLFFLPHHLLFFILPGEYALSFQGIYYNLLFLVSVSWLLRNLGVNKFVSYASAIMILFSHFYQVWWTSNFAALGASLLPFAILTSNLRGHIKYTFLFWSIGHTIFGQIYPPFYISIVYGVLPFILIVKSDLINKKLLILSFIGFLMAVLFYVLMKFDYILAVSNTSYPGLRFSNGGDVSLHLLFSIIIPTIPIPDQDPHLLYNMSAVGTILPCLCLSLLPFIRWDFFSKRITLFVIFMSFFMCFYMVIGFPDWLSRISFFYLVPGKRMIIGLSLLINFYSAIMVSRHWDTIRLGSIILFNIFFLCAFLFGIRKDIITEFFVIRWYNLIPFIISVLGIVIYISFRRVYFSHLILVGMSIFHLVSFGSFNPIIKAKHIMSLVDTQITRDVKALIIKNSGKAVSIIGNYGHVLRGEGLAVYNAIHLVNVDKEIYQEYFNVDDQSWNDLFNRFVGIAFDNIENFQSGVTNFFPATIGGVSFKHQIINNFIGIEKDDNQNVAVNISITSVIPSENGFIIFWKAFLEKPSPISSSVQIRISCDWKDSWLTRYPLNIQASETYSSALQGLAGNINIQANNAELARECVNKMIIYTIDY